MSVKLAVQAPDVEKKFKGIISTLDDFILQHDKKASEVDVLIYEIGEDPPSEFEVMRELLKDGIVRTIFLTSKNSSSEVLVPALRTGAKEFFEQPIIEKDVRNAFHKVLELHNIKNKEQTESLVKGKIIGIFGAKGGVGTTTFAVNLANSIQLRNPEKTVALFDMNRLLGEIPILLDLETNFNCDELATNINRLDKDFLCKALVKHNSGMYVMPAPTRVDASLKPQTMLEILEKTKDSFDFVIIDIGMQIDDLMYSILGMSEIIYLISILSLPCMINVKRQQESLFHRKGITTDKVRVILNRFEKNSSITLEEAEKVINNTIFAKIPNDYKSTMKAINIGKPLADVAKGAKIEKAYTELAKSLVEVPVSKKKRKGWFW